MMSCQGFLTPGPDRRPRMTKKHKVAVFKAVQAAIDHMIDKRQNSVIETNAIHFAIDIMTEALEYYPADRSCFTCDWFHGRQCVHWNDTVPDSAIEAGCDKHKEQGAPF